MCPPNARRLDFELEEDPIGMVRRRLLMPVVCLVAAVGLVPVAAEATDTPHGVVVSDNPVNWTPNVLTAGGQVNAIVQIGDTIVVGGDFTQVREAGSSTTLTRTYLFAFNATTGVISLTFAPVLDAKVLALLPAPDGSVYASGAFNTVNGVSRRKIVKLNVSTGQVITAFNANTGGFVHDMALRGNRLFVAGSFTAIRGVPIQALATLDPTTGNVDTSYLNFSFTDPRTGNKERVLNFDITPDGSRMIAIGNFQRVSGTDHKQIVMFDLGPTSATIANWQTDMYPQVVPNTTTSWCSPTYDTYMRDVDFSPDGSYFVIGTTGAYRANRLCDSISRWETSATGSGLTPTWVDWTGGDSLTQVAATGTAVYAGGHQRWQNNPYRGDNPGPGAVDRVGIAALDPVNGMPFTWDPTRSRGNGVFAFLATPQGLWIGSDTDLFANETRQKLAFLPVAGGSTPPVAQTASLPADLVNLELGGNMVRRGYDGATFGPASVVPTGVDWSQARGVLALDGQLYTGWSDGNLYRRTFDGSTVGPAIPLDLHGLNVQPPNGFFIPGTTIRIPAFTTQLQNATGMFYDGARIYYTVQGDPRLYYRYFTFESEIVGASLFVSSTNADGVDWGAVRGMTLSSGQLYFASSNGALSRVAFANGSPSGAPVVIGGPAVDGYNWASRGLFAFASAPAADTTPPTQPGKPTGVSNAGTSIDLSWAASTDDVSSELTYRVYRDGDASPVGTVVSSSTGIVGFNDSGLAPGSTHTYMVTATDESDNTGPASASSDPITTVAAFFADDFSSAGFGAWTTVTRLTIDPGNGATTPPSARGSVAGQSAFAAVNLAAPQSTVCMSLSLNVESHAAEPIVVMRLRTATNGPVARVFLSANGTLFVKSDVSGVQRSASGSLTPGWHSVELCGTIGTSTTWDLLRDGGVVIDDWAADTGTTPVGRVEIGDTSARTWTTNFDDVVVDSHVG